MTQWPANVNLGYQSSVRSVRLQDVPSDESRLHTSDSGTSDSGTDSRANTPLPEPRKPQPPTTLSLKLHDTAPNLEPSKARMRVVTAAREATAELLGTMVLIMFGCGSVAQSVLSHGANGGMLSINLGWGLGVLIGIMVAGPISGAHLNPAVSLALAAVGKFPWRKVGHYILAQYIGAFLGAGLVFFTYKDALDMYTGDGPYQVEGANATAGIFVTFPSAGVSNFNGAVDQVVGTALLLFAICAINLPSNKAVSSSMGPLLVALVVVNIGICFGHNAGYAINPARDLGPRLFLLVGGWGAEAFTSHGHWWWIPVVMCHLGGLVGAALHWAGLETAWPGEPRGEDKSVV